MGSMHYGAVGEDHDVQSRMLHWEFRTVYNSDPTYPV